MRVERLQSPPRSDSGSITFPQEIHWPATRIVEEGDVFEIEAALPVPIVSHDQVLFVTLRDLWEVVARVHVTYTDARTLRRGEFRQWYPAEPAPKVDNSDKNDTQAQTAFDALASNERTTFRLVYFSDDGDLYAHSLDPTPASHRL